MNKSLPKVVVILGPTASGKTELGLILARQFNGEIISADSRQVYRQMMIGTAKPAGVWQEAAPGERAYVVRGIPHYLMDLIEPDEQMSADEFKRRAEDHIKAIRRRGKLPIIVGGTGLYISALIDNWEAPRVPPDRKLRQELEAKSVHELNELLDKLDPRTAVWIDRKNPRRLVRALEVAIKTSQSFTAQRQRGIPLYNALRLGISWPPKELRARLERRVEEQIEAGLVAEVQHLLDAGFDANLPGLSSLGLTEAASYLRGECTLAEATRKIKINTWRYAKRQLTWFKRDREIVWIPGGGSQAAIGLIKEFLRRKF